MFKEGLLLATIASLYGISLQQAVSNCKVPGKLADNSEICIECNDGYYLNSSYTLNFCYECPARCSKCNIQKETKGLICTNCTEGYRFNLKDYSCIECPSNCKVCDEKTCQECFEGYTLNPDRVCDSKSNFMQYAFIAAVIVGVVFVIWWVYKTYLKGTPEDPMNQVNESNYNKDKEKEFKKLEAPLKGGRRANPDNN